MKMTRFIKSRVSNPNENNILHNLFKDYQYKIKNKYKNKNQSLIISVTASKE